MATYHLHVRIISRSKGRSSVAAAAYRSCAKIQDERQGLSFDYRKKGDCVYSEILAPDNAAKWMYDREQLWNHIELIENRKNSQLSRDIEIALPKELSLEQNTELIRQYIKQNFISMGMVADLNIHDKDNNPHAHIMLTMRRIKGNGFGPKKEARDWNAKHLTLKWRRAWAQIHNQYMAKNGFDIQIDHRSYEEQGINIIPQIKLGIAAYRKDPEFDRVAQYKRIAFENGKEIIEKPWIALDHMTRMQATFTHDDILKYVHEHSDPSQFYDAVSAIERCPELTLVQENDYSRYNRYTTRAMIDIENQMLKDASDLARQKSHHVPANIIEQAIVNHRLSDEQATALRQTVNGNDLHIIIGHAGTGKTYTMGAMKEVYEAQGYKLQGVALANVAAKGLERETGIPSTSIARKLFQWENGSHQLDNKTVLIVDEAGMVGTRQMQKLNAEAKRAGAKIIPIGDRKQTQAVESGGAFRGMVEVAETSRLQQVWRQRVDWQIEATHLFSGNERDIGKGIDLYVQHGMVHEHKTINEAAAAMLEDYVQSYSHEQSAFMTTFTNEHINRLNQLCRHNLKLHTDCIGSKEYEYNTADGVKLFAAGDRIQFFKIDREMGVDNGTFGTVKKVDKNGCMVVELGRGHTITFDTQNYDAITYGYAATVHKLQGATVDKCYVLASEGFDRHLSYVAMSRHRNEMNLYWSRDNYENLEHLKRTFSNLNDKELVKDFADTQDIIEKRLTQLTRHEATFKEEDLQAAAVGLDEMQQHELIAQIVPVGGGIDGQLHYTTQEMLATEERLLKKAEILGRRTNHAQGASVIKKAVGQRVSDELLRFAIGRTLDGADLSVVESRHQKDKIYIARLLAQVYKEQDYMVDAVTLSGAGADNFEKATGIQSATTFKRLWEMANGKNVLNDRSVLIVDNANMIGTRVMDQLIGHVEKANAKLILLGDRQLTQSVGAGGPYRGIIERSRGNVAYVDREKDKFEWPDHAKKLLRQDRVAAAKAVDMLAAGGMVHKAQEGHLFETVVGDWLQGVRNDQSYKSNIMLTYRNADVATLNALAREKLSQLGYLDRASEIIVENFEREKLRFAAGDRIMFLQKDGDLGVQGGTLGSVRRTGEDWLDVRLDDGTRVEVNTRLYNDLAHGYATNIYKSANMKVENTFIMTTGQFTKQTFAAALEVHTQSAKIYHSGSYKKFRNIVSRPRDKELVADYPMAPRAYKISVTPFKWAAAEVKYIEVAPQVNKENLKTLVSRQAQSFAAQVAGRLRLNAEQVKDMVIKVEQISMDQYQKHQLSKDRRIGKDRGRGL